jgi:signal transduction histidine kinase/ActR/RegA family two-component response regulator
MPFTTHTFVRDRREDIMREWEKRVASEAREIKLADSALRNHLPEFLDELADWMQQGEAPGTSRMRAAAARHAAQRVDHAFQLTQLIHEYRLLRATILHLLLNTEAADQDLGAADGMAERVVELARLNAGLDFAIMDAVESFVEERERRFGEVRDQATMLRELDRRKGEFLAVLSHELRNPLTPIRNSLFLLDQAAPGSEQADRARTVLLRQTEHLTNLVDELLDMTRMSRGKVELHREILDARNIVRPACDDHRTLFEQYQIDLRFEDPARPVWTNADAHRLSQVLGNLLQNAAKFTPPGGRVVVSLSVGKPDVEIRVRDTGIGLEAHELERMFEPYAQVENTLARTHGGLGLGLALVKGLVEMHGGHVSANSEGLGHGCEIVLTLPLAVPPAGAAEKAPVVTATSGTFVLLIEDNVDAAETLAEVLELSGHRVRLAYDGTTGIQMARELKPEVVLCDIGLPDVNGYEVARTLRADPSLGSTRLIAVTGYAQYSDKQKAMDAGFDAHLTKPPDLVKLNKLLAKEGERNAPSPQSVP